MATYASLTASEKSIVEAWDRNNRGWLNSLATLLVQARALKASADTSGGAGDIISSLNEGECIPNTGGIAGSQKLTKEVMTELRMIGLDDFVTKYDTPDIREYIAKAAGPTAGL
jgi:hypothetical protein